MTKISSNEHFNSDCPNDIYSMSMQVSEVDLDVFGHVNNANYLKYFEKARWNFLHQNGFGWERIKDENQGPVLLEVVLKFKKELKAMDTITILSQVQKVESRFLTIKQVILKSDNKLSAEATFFLGFFDLNSRKLIVPPASWLHAVGVKK